MSDATPYYVVLYYAPNEQQKIAIGVMLFEPSTELLIMRFRQDWLFAEEDDREVLVELASRISSLVTELGGTALLEYCESTLSTAMQVSERRYIESSAVDLTAAFDDIVQYEFAR